MGANRIAAPVVATSLRAYFASLAALGKRRLAGLLALVLLGAVVEGLGIVMLVPLSSLMFGWTIPDSGPGRLAASLLSRFGQSEGLAWVLAGFVALMAVRALVLIRRDSGLFVLSSELVDRWRGRLIAALVHAEWRQLRGLNRGQIEFAVTGDVSRLAVGSDQLLRGGVALVQMTVLVGLAIRLAPMLALAVAALLVPALPLAARLTRGAYAYGQQMTRQGGNRQGAFAEFMAGMKLAKAHRAEDRYADEFMALTAQLREIGVRFTATRLRSNAAFELLAALLAAAVLWVGIVVLHVQPALLGAILVLFARMPGPALALAQGVQSFAMLLPAIDNLLAIERSLGAEPTPVTAGSDPRDGPARVSLRGVALRHDPARPLLDEVDLTLAPGELVVLLGPSGSGKTSLADVLIGLVAPDAGVMEVDDAPIASHTARARWREHIAYVPQDPFLFDTTLADNLRWAAPMASDAELWAALETAEAADLVRALPDGLETRAGERGNLFSGGERQRLCLARALLLRPALLVLDEATNALDVDSEARLLKVVEGLRGKVTTVLITHRLPAGFRADRVLRLAGGRLGE